MALTLEHAPLCDPDPMDGVEPIGRRPRRRLAPWCAPVLADGWTPPWVPVARRVTLSPPPARSEEAESFASSMAEALEHAEYAAKHRRFPRLPKTLRTDEVDVLGLSRRDNAACLLFVVRDDADAAAYAALRALQQTLVWSWACDVHRDGLVVALNELGRRATESPPAVDRVVSRYDFELVPVIAFDRPPELATVRRVVALLAALEPLSPERILGRTQLWAWPRGLAPFRIPPRAASPRPSRRRCPTCGSPYVVSILRGYPTDEALAAARRGEFALGGCVVSDLDPSWTCRACGREG